MSRGALILHVPLAYGICVDTWGWCPGNVSFKQLWWGLLENIWPRVWAANHAGKSALQQKGTVGLYMQEDMKAKATRISSRAVPELPHHLQLAVPFLMRYEWRSDQTSSSLVLKPPHHLDKDSSTAFKLNSFFSTWTRFSKAFTKRMLGGLPNHTGMFHMHEQMARSSLHAPVRIKCQTSSTAFVNTLNQLGLANDMSLVMWL